VAEGGQEERLTRIDGAKEGAEAGEQSGVGGTAELRLSRPFAKFATLSKTGYIPFNPEKVNQDRACEVISFGGDHGRAFFGAFDGHGTVGHEVSTFVSTKLPGFILKQPDFNTDVERALTRAHIECNTKLARGRIDCTFSGTTCVTIYLCGSTIYCCNVGDSRCVLGARSDQIRGLQAKPLSVDQKPDRQDEAKRINDRRGRVEACKGQHGEDIGPLRVWVYNQEVPGLAMTRSFGDLIAASVGVIPDPEIIVHERTEDDVLAILGSDGVWEFISSQEAVDLIAEAESPERACRILVEEATKRWKAEEEVIDDITAIVVFF
jgi:serine/threonine protein phosphatase PrpC